MLPEATYALDLNTQFSDSFHNVDETMHEVKEKLKITLDFKGNFGDNDNK